MAWYPSRNGRGLVYEPAYYTYTEHPELFREVYWGGHRGKPENSILQNRSKFVKDYGITKVCDGLHRNKTRLFDILHIVDDDNRFRINENTINYKKSEYYNDNDFKDYYLYYKTPTIHICTNSSFSLIDTHVFRRDHPEYYISKKYPDCIVHIFSQHTSDEQHKLIIEDGYKEIYPLYAEDQRTYIKIAPKLKKDYHMINTIEYPE